MQMICALLIFQTPELPAPLWHLSPWLDHMVVPLDFVYAQLAEQPHRRFIKTHTPLDGIPLDPRVTYIVTARHPLDMFVSLCRHNEIIGPPPDIVGPPPPRTGPPPTPAALRRTGMGLRPAGSGTHRTGWAPAGRHGPPPLSPLSGQPPRRSRPGRRAAGAARVTRDAARRPAQLDRRR